jgi:hypothetical protein
MTTKNNFEKRVRILKRCVSCMQGLGLRNVQPWMKENMGTDADPLHSGLMPLYVDFLECLVS